MGLPQPAPPYTWLITMLVEACGAEGALAWSGEADKALSTPYPTPEPSRSPNAGASMELTSSTPTMKPTTSSEGLGRNLPFFKDLAIYLTPGWTNCR
ncbi:MAG: hypothetical protein M3328_10305 [Chloroflexota bacterium]|nr:hypothetical protein [Chloroflexota bacterium]